MINPACFSSFAKCQTKRPVFFNQFDQNALERILFMKVVGQCSAGGGGLSAEASAQAGKKGEKPSVCKEFFFIHPPAPEK
jgi:hypothetical protein